MGYQHWMGLSLGLCFILLLFCGPVLSVKCYQCSSEDPECAILSKKNLPIPDYRQECPGAIGCIIYQVSVDFTFDPYFQRACFHEQDKKCYGDAAQESSFPEKGSGTVWKHAAFQYSDAIACLNKVAPAGREKGQTRPIKQHFTNGHAQSFAFKVTFGELSNSEGWDKIFATVDSRKRRIPPTKTLMCYSCEGVSQDKSLDPGTNAKHSLNLIPLPPCPGAKAKIINCESSFGCGAFQMTRYEQQQYLVGGAGPLGSTSTGPTLNPHQLQQVYKIWRGCWSPGDLKCLQTYTPSYLGRSSGFTAWRKQDEKTPCGVAYEKKEPLVWTGKTEIDTIEGYANFLNCTRRNRPGNSDNFINPSSFHFNPSVTIHGKATTVDYAEVRYHFCGNSNLCNDAQNTPPVTPLGGSDNGKTEFGVDSSSENKTLGIRNLSLYITEDYDWDGCDKGKHTGLSAIALKITPLKSAILQMLFLLILANHLYSYFFSK